MYDDIFILLDVTLPQIIFSNKHELRGIDLVTRDVKSLVSSLKNTVTLDFYHAKDGTDMLYWADVMDDKIFRGTLIGGCMLIEVLNFSLIIFYNDTFNF